MLDINSYYRKTLWEVKGVYEITKYPLLCSANQREKSEYGQISASRLNYLFKTKFNSGQVISWLVLILSAENMLFQDNVIQIGQCKKLLLYAVCKVHIELILTFECLAKTLTKLLHYFEHFNLAKTNYRRLKLIFDIYTTELEKSIEIVNDC